MDLDFIETPQKDFPVIKHPGKFHFEGFKAVSKASPEPPPIHVHPMAFLLHIYEGRIASHSSQGMLPLTAGHYVYVPKHCVHTEVFLSPEVSCGLIKLPDELTIGLPLHVTPMEVSPLIKALYEEVISWGLVDEHSAEQRKVIDVFTDQLKLCRASKAAPLSWPKDSSLRTICDLIAKDPGIERTVDEWATVAGMSSRTFARKFQEETGLSFLKWHNHFKVTVAMRRLAKGQSIKSVAFELGFKSSSALNQLFRLHAGVSPSEFFRSEKNFNESAASPEASTHVYAEIIAHQG